MKTQSRMRFVVEGEPQGKGRPRYAAHTSKTGRTFVQTYTPHGTVAYENRIKDAFMQAYPQAKPIERNKPLAMLIDAYCPIPASTRKADREAMLDGIIRPTKKPDADNIEKSVLDALNGIMYDDDTQVVDVHIRKFYSNKPRLEVTVISAMLLTQAGRIAKKTEDSQCRMNL